MTIRMFAVSVLIAGSGLAAAGGARAGDLDSFPGEALVRSDAHGRVVVAIDLSPPDGRTDRVFLFTPARPVAHRLRILLRDAMVTHQPGVLRATSAVSPDRVDLLLAGEPDIQNAGRSLAITGGLGIVEVHGDFGEAGIGLDTVNTDDWTGVTTPDAAVGPSCPSGGPFSSHCAIGCGGGVMGGHLTISCETDCREGSYACCSCQDGILIPHCYCVVEEGTIQPPKVRPATP